MLARWGSYLGYMTDTATDLIAGNAGQSGGQWRVSPLVRPEKDRLYRAV